MIASQAIALTSKIRFLSRRFFGVVGCKSWTGLRDCSEAWVVGSSSALLKTSHKQRISWWRRKPRRNGPGGASLD